MQVLGRNFGKQIRRWGAAVVGLLCLAGLGEGAHAQTPPASSGVIAFSSNRDGNNEIYVMNADGSNPTRLTQNSFDDIEPSFSPDGSKIAFVSNRDGNNEIYTMNVDGSGLRRVTAWPSSTERQPSWSADGGQLVFVSNSELIGAYFDHNGNWQFRHFFWDGLPKFDPAFSPDGDTIVFACNYDQADYLDRNGIDICALNLLDGSIRIAANRLGDDRGPVFSKDGRSIIFSGVDSGEERALYEVPVASKSRPPRANALIFYPGALGDPALSPSGSELAFSLQSTEPTAPNAPGEIYLAEPGGANVRNISNSPAHDAHPSWAPGKIVIANVTDASILEGDQGTSKMLFPVTLSHAAPHNITMTYSTRDDTARAGSDYGSTSDRLTIPAGSLSGTIEVPVYGDNEFEPVEKFFLTLSNVTGAIIAKTQLVGTIVNDEPTGLRGGKVAFSSKRYGSFDIFLMNADGSHVTRLTNFAGEETDPVFSPDGSKILFNARDGVTGTGYAIWVMNADGGNQKQLTFRDSRYINADIGDYAATWSPDGSKILFNSNRDSTWEIYLMNADGSNPSRLTYSGNGKWSPVFSPDGSRIIFCATNGTGVPSLYSMNANGSEPTLLYGPLLAMFRPRFSPDGRHIIMRGHANNDPFSTNSTVVICRINADGSGFTPLTNDRMSRSNGSYSPDGSRIIFNGYTNGSTLADIYTMNADGTGTSPVLIAVGDDGEPSWARGDIQAPPAISIQDASVSEGHSGTTAARFTVSLSAPAPYPVWFRYVTANGSAVGSIDGSNDYAYTTIPVMFAPGEHSKTVEVPVIGDTALETNETFMVNLTEVMNATIADGQATGTILDDDADNIAPTVTIAAPLSNGAYIGALPETISGTVSDNSGVSYVSSVRWRLRGVFGGVAKFWNASTGTWDNTQVQNATTPTRPSNDAAWSSTGILPRDDRSSGGIDNLPAGTYTLNAYATDKKGNSSYITHTLLVDKAAPAVTIAAPLTHNAVITALPSTITGTVNDDLGISNVSVVRWRLRGVLNGVVQYWNATTGSWSTTVVLNSTNPRRPSPDGNWSSAGLLPLDNSTSGGPDDLPNGTYMLTAYANDKAGRSSYISHTITVRKSVTVAALTRGSHRTW